MKKQSWSLFKLAPWILALAVAPLDTVADSLWKDDAAKPMFADKRAASVGDLVTIIVQESSSTAKDASTKSSKKSGIDASISSFLYAPGASGLMTKGGKMPAVKLDNSTTFDGSGSVGSTETITSRITVRVVDVLPNRNLLIEGSRKTTFSGETQDVVLRGTIRPEDIMANNSIYSYNVADVNLKFISRGTVSDSQKKGWFTRTWDKISPF